MRFDTSHISWMKIAIVWVILGIVFVGGIFILVLPAFCGAMNLEPDPDDGKVRRPIPNLGPPGTYAPQWSADGANILFGSFILSTSASSADIEFSEDVFHSSLSPDRSRVAFATIRHGNNYEIGVSGPGGSNYSRLTDSEFSESHPVWSPDGSRIAFIRGGALYAMDSDGSNVEKLAPRANSIGHQAWSPDGRKLAFLDRKNSSYHFYTVAADGSSLTKIAEAVSSLPAWAPDGNAIVIMLGYEPTVLTVNPDGSGMRELVTLNLTLLPQLRLGPNRRLSWSPDSSEILLQEHPFIRVKADGSGYGVFTGMSGIDDAYASWTPDGSRIAVDIAQYDNPVRSPGSRVRLFTMDLNGSDKRSLVNFHYTKGDLLTIKSRLEPAYGEPVDSLTHWAWFDAQGEPVPNPQ